MTSKSSKRKLEIVSDGNKQNEPFIFIHIYSSLYVNKSSAAFRCLKHTQMKYLIQLFLHVHTSSFYMYIAFIDKFELNSRYELISLFPFLTDAAHFCCAICWVEK